MRILFIDPFVTYVNQTRNLLPLVIEGASTYFRVFGQGYVTESTLKAGLCEYIKKNGPFDFLISTELIPVAATKLKRGMWTEADAIKAWRSNYFTFDPSQVYYSWSIFDEFLQFKGPKIISIMQTDFYNLGSAEIEAFCSADYLMCWGDEFLLPASEVDSATTLAQVPSDDWRKIVLDNPEKIISFPAFVSENEFNCEPLSSRPNDWSILGVRYGSRREAAKQLKSYNIKVSGGLLQLFIDVLLKLRLKPFSRIHGIKLFNHLFQHTLAKSKYSYTCGSAVKYPVRKFFEIPAQGTVLVCDPCMGFKALGFKHLHNAIACTPKQVKLISDFLVHRIWSQSVASLGRRLVWEKHTVSARQRQLYKCLMAIKDGWFAGSYWQDGEFCLRQQGKQ